MKKFKNHYNYKGQTKMRILEPSKTIQGETLSIQQLFDRAAVQGHLPIEEGNANYIDVEDLNQITNMYRQGLDLTDLHAHAKHLAEQSEHIKQLQIKQKQKAQIELKEAEKHAIIEEHKISEAKKTAIQAEQPK